MARQFDWETIRAEYEAGSTQSALARKHGCSRTAIQKRIASEGWMQDVTDAINRIAQAKVAGIVAGCNPQKKAEAMDKAADAKAAVIIRHKTEWNEHNKLIRDAIADEDFEKAKMAKITAETIRIRQEGERRAWGINDKIEADVSGGLVITWQK